MILYKFIWKKKKKARTKSETKRKQDGSFWRYAASALLLKNGSK